MSPKDPFEVTPEQDITNLCGIFPDDSKCHAIPRSFDEFWWSTSSDSWGSPSPCGAACATTGAASTVPGSFDTTLTGVTSQSSPASTADVTRPTSSNSGPASSSSASLGTLSSTTASSQSFMTTIPVTVSLPTTTFTTFSVLSSPPTNTSPTLGSATPASNLAAVVHPVCIGHGLDASAVGLIATAIVTGVIGILLWVIFATIRPHFKQLYGVREWFAPQDCRPKPLQDTLWAFLFPHVPFVPSIPGETAMSKHTAADNTNFFPTDAELGQRVLWTCFLIVLGWTLLGLAGALPLYLVNTPCIANSIPLPHFGGAYSTLQDLSLLRLLQLVQEGNVANTETLQRREVVDGKDFASNVRTRLIILTVFVLVLGMLPALHKLLKLYNRLVNYRNHWMEIRCEGLEMGWLSISRAPGFTGWGERRLKEFLVKIGLSHSLDRSARNASDGNLAGIGAPFRGTPRNQARRRSESQLLDAEKVKPEIDIRTLFTIGETYHVAMLIEERDRILDQLEVAETRYISSFRIATPDPSLADMPIPQPPPKDDDDELGAIKRTISRPRALIGSSKRPVPGRRRRGYTPSGAPTSYVAPSQYYKLRGVRGVSGGRFTSNTALSGPSFSDTVKQRIVGSRFQEMNRDSNVYAPLSIGSPLVLDRMGELSPIPPSPEPAQRESGGTNSGGAPRVSIAQSFFPVAGDESNADSDSWDDAAMATAPASPQPTSHPTSNHTSHSYGNGTVVASPVPPSKDTDSPQLRKRPERSVPSARRETFAMRDNTNEVDLAEQHPPPHLRLQPQQPFVRPVSGIDHDDLGAVYQEIRDCRARLKQINAEIADAQNECYNEIADGSRIKGWLVTGRGIRYIPGIRMIEGRSKMDVRWNELQNEGDFWTRIGFWITVFMISLLLGMSVIGVAGLAVGIAPDVSHYLTFLRPLLDTEIIASGIATILAPALATTLFMACAYGVVSYAAHFSGCVSVSATQLITLKAFFIMALIVGTLWLSTAGALIFSLEAFATSTGRTQTIANGVIYMSMVLLAIVINVAIIVPALMLLQPRRFKRVILKERQAITPRQWFRAVYPGAYDPTYAMGCCVIAIIFAAGLSAIFPLIGLAVVLLLVLTLVANRYLIGYVYGRDESPTGGLVQIWLVRRFATVVALQPIVYGLLLLTRHLWIEGGISVGVGVAAIIFVEVYAHWKAKLPGHKYLSAATETSLDMFIRAAHPSKNQPPDDEGASLVNSQRPQVRGSFASVLEMMSLTLAITPSSYEMVGAVPLETEVLDDLVATERAARTHPDAPPRLPPLPFADHAEEMSGILYAPELTAPPPIIWLPNDTSGVARSEVFDLQRYHSLQATLDVRSVSDVLPRRSTSSRHANRDHER